MRHIVYWIFGLGSLGALWFSAPAGGFLTGSMGPAEAAQTPKGRRTVRAARPMFFWLGGGYHGGK